MEQSRVNCIDYKTCVSESIKKCLILIVFTVNNILILAVPSMIVILLIGFPQLNELYKFEGPIHLALIYGLLGGSNFTLCLVCIGSSILEFKDSTLQELRSPSMFWECFRVNFITVPIYWIPKWGILAGMNIATKLQAYVKSM